MLGNLNHCDASSITRPDSPDSTPDSELEPSSGPEVDSDDPLDTPRDGKLREAPTIAAALAALADLKDTLRGQSRGKSGGYSPCQNHYGGNFQCQGI